MAVPVDNEQHMELSAETYHYVQEMDDNTLTEEIREIVSDISDPNGITSNAINLYLYGFYGVLNNKHIQNRIDSLLTYIRIKGDYEREMRRLLQKKDKPDLFTECSLECDAKCTASNIFSDCEPLKRIDLILSTYYSLMQEEQLCEKVSLAALLMIDDRYGRLQMLNDFLHIKLYHIESQSSPHHEGEEDEKRNEKSIANDVCYMFETRYKCDDMDTCDAFKRHYRGRTNAKNARDMFHIAADPDNAQEWIFDIIFQEEFDKIHCYFLHSTIQFPEDKHGPPRSWSIKAREHDLEDKEWFNQFSDDVSPDDGYKLLIERMGIFRWQSSHGFRTGHNRGLMHLKPKFANLKEEALDNSFYTISKDLWNNTFLRCRLFYQSFARQRVHTLSAGSYRDEISNMHSVWDEKECIQLQEVMTLKLYTDFDKLQHELQKCFRSETMIGFIYVLRTDEDVQNDANRRNDLENRLCEFFHWRISLLTVLTKYGAVIDKKLYYATNSKMILNPAETMAFYGPLSVTSSYDIAKTLASDKGMVLEITSLFPRLQFSCAFDVSLTSDYPEHMNNEYLVSFMYLRVLKVHTRPLVKGVTTCELWKASPLQSKTRDIFFSIHLFKEQIFSMSPHLEYYLVNLLKCNRLDCCENITKSISTSFLLWLCCEIAHHPNSITSARDWICMNGTDNCYANRNIITILWTKFSLFRYEKQVIKIDCVSDGLKPFFFDKLSEKDVFAHDKYAVSFKKILQVFPNAKEIRFINNYRFDDDILQKLLDMAKDQSNNRHKHEHNHLQTDPPPKPGLDKVVFLYYNYDTRARYPITSDAFFNPNDLDKNKIIQLEAMNWAIKAAPNGNIGFKIRICKKNRYQPAQQFMTRQSPQVSNIRRDRNYLIQLLKATDIPLMNDSVNANAYITLQIHDVCINAQQGSTITSLHCADTSNPEWNCYRTFQASELHDTLMFQIWIKYGDIRDEHLLGGAQIKISEATISVYKDEEDETYEDSLQTLTIHLTNDNHEKTHETKLYFRLFVTEDQIHDEDEPKECDASSKQPDHGLIQRNNTIGWVLLENAYIQHHIPLNQWNVDDVCGRLIKWIFNDFQYQSHLSRTQSIFGEHRLDGEKLQHLSPDDVKCIIKEEMLQFVTIDTLNIMCDGLNLIKPIMLMNDDEMRASWDVSSVVEIYSTKSKQWHKGEVMKVFTDEEGEWLEVQYVVDNTQRVKQTARHDKAIIRTIKPHISCQDIARLLYNYPINQLMCKIHDQRLDGSKLLNLLKNEIVCGWTQEEVEQIQQILFKEMTLTEAEFARRMRKHELNDDAQHILNEIIDTMDIEQIQYNIKHNHDTVEFSDMVRHMVDEIVLNDKANQCVLVNETYTNIAQCFLHNEPHLSHWLCCRCGNNNFNEHKYSNDKSISYCSLCGISQIDSVIRNIRNVETLVPNHKDELEEKATDTDEAESLYLDLVEEVIEAEHIELICRGRTDDMRCPSILRLAQCLIEYKQWIGTIVETDGKYGIEHTTEIDIGCIHHQQLKEIFTACVQSDSVAQMIYSAFNLDLVIKRFTEPDNPDDVVTIRTFVQTGKKKFIEELFKRANVQRNWGRKFYNAINKQISDDMDHDTFQNVFVESAKCIHNALQRSYNLKSLIDTFHKNINDIKDFKTMSKTSFVDMMRTKGNISTRLSEIVYTKFRTELTHAAQRHRLQSMDFETVDRDYRHILEIHIENGDKTSVTSVFKFFNHILHWNDNPTQIEECKSLERMIDRIEAMNDKSATNIHCNDIQSLNYEDTVSLQQYYIQSQLDVIHSYLVHSPWKTMVKHLTNQDNGETLVECEEEPKVTTKKDKYITEYGFGVFHEHLRLSPTFHSIYDEMMHNIASNLDA
eukprot:3241_1